MSKLKKNIQDNGGFQHWFVNVFWYHYKWPLLIGVVVLGIIPILGPLLASSLYKRTLVNPYSLYMTVFRESFLMVVLYLCRHLFRLLPFIGTIGMPILCVTEYLLYRRMFRWKT